VLFHELGENLVLAAQLGFEMFDLLVLGVFDCLGLAAVLEGQIGAFEELALPLVELDGIDLALIAQGRNGDSFERDA
jgi:hypothetical protein